MHEGLRAAGLPEDAVQVVATTDRAAVGHLITDEAHVDVLRTPAHLLHLIVLVDAGSVNRPRQRDQRREPRTALQTQVADPGAAWIARTNRETGAGQQP